MLTPVDHVIERSKCPADHAVKRRFGGKLLYPTLHRMNIFQLQLMLNLSQEAHALAQAVQQRELTLRTHDRERDTRQARTGAYINKTFALEVRRHDDAVENVAHQHLIRVANRGEVIGLVPFVQHIDIPHQLIFLVIGERNTGLIQQTSEFVEHGEYLLRCVLAGGATLTRPTEFCRPGSLRITGQFLRLCAAAQHTLFFQPHQQNGDGRRGDAGNTRCLADG